MPKTIRWTTLHFWLEPVGQQPILFLAFHLFPLRPDWRQVQHPSSSCLSERSFHGIEDHPFLSFPPRQKATRKRNVRGRVQADTFAAKERRLGRFASPPLCRHPRLGAASLLRERADATARQRLIALHVAISCNHPLLGRFNSSQGTGREEDSRLRHEKGVDSKPPA